MRSIQRWKVWDKSKDGQTEARAVIKYLLKKVMTPKKIHKDTAKIRTEDSSSNPTGKKLTVEFKRSRDCTEDDPRSDHPKTSITDAEVDSSHYMVVDDRHYFWFCPHCFNWGLVDERAFSVSKECWRLATRWEGLTFSEHFWLAFRLTLIISTADKKLKMKSGFTISKLNQKFKVSSENTLILHPHKNVQYLLVKWWLL